GVRTRVEDKRRRSRLSVRVRADDPSPPVGARRTRSGRRTAPGPMAAFDIRAMVGQSAPHRSEEATHMALTLAEANAVVQGAVDKAREMGIKISVAVCDAGGRLMAFNRMDGAIWGAVYGSQGKAIASVAFGRASGELQERAGSPIIQGIAAAEGGHMIPSQGAVPIIRNGAVDGACGVGGGTSQQDEDCARAGVAKL